MDDNIAINVSDGKKLEFFRMIPSSLLDQTIAIYGRRASGKSTILYHIMYVLKDYIPTVFVVSQSAVAYNPYKGKVPLKCIKNDISKEWMRKFLTKQKGRANKWHNANDIDILERIFMKIQNSESIMIKRKIELKAQFYISSIENNTRKAETIIKKEQIRHIETLRDASLKKLYKDYIKKYKIHLLQTSILTDEERDVVKYIDMDPSVLLIFDDCASMMKKWTKECPEFKEIMYNGRWYKITIIVLFQDDIEFSPELRKNCTIQIFTAQESAICNFGKTSNGYPKYIRERSENCVKTIWNTRNSEFGIPNYKKLVYLLESETGDRFRYTIADLHDRDKFRMGDPSLWACSERVVQSDMQNSQDIRQKVYGDL